MKLKQNRNKIWGCSYNDSARHPVLRPRYFAGSATHREIAVTTFRGAKRTDSATSQFLNPEIASVFPAINAAYPSAATVFASIGDICLNSREFSVCARF